MPRALFRTAAFLAVGAALVFLTSFLRNGRAASPADQARHGLTGSFYVATRVVQSDPPPSSIYPHLEQAWIDPNDFLLPRLFSGPAATRLDPQVAFGQGKGFHAPRAGPPIVWWPTGFAMPGWPDANSKPWDGVVAVIWRGYIHLPKAGTYYFATVSNGASAVYLNQARVALNGIYGTAVVSDAFRYTKEDVQDLVQNLFQGREDILSSRRPAESYALPVTIEAPRDLPIEVQYTPAWHFTHWASEPLGIDLFWVTPDAPRDASGKPLARIVPAEALYAEPPGPIEKSAVRGAASMVTADHLYFPTGYVEGAVVVTIRLADRDGNPVAGKRVYVSSLPSFGNSDVITQPEKPTDEKGETTAMLRAGPDQMQHESKIFATDITDLVDVAQVAHVIFQPVESTFFTDAYSPYYDRRFRIDPLPVEVGKPATIQTELKNRSKFPAKVTVRFLTTDANIGFGNWAEIARVEDLALSPGESKTVRTQFTAKEPMGHKCFRVEVSGSYTAGNVPAGVVYAATPLPPSAQDRLLDWVQINTAAVSHCTPAGMALFTLLGGGIADFCYSGPCPPGTDTEYVKIPPADPLGAESRVVPHCLGGGGGLRLPNHLPPLHLPKLAPGRPKGDTSGPPSSVPPFDAGKNTSVMGAGGTALNCDGFLVQAEQARKAGNEAEYSAWIKTYEDCVRERGAWNGAAQDPSDPAYRRLAVAATDTPVGYLDAVRVSMERYRAAEDAGDGDWMARHLTAMERYFQRLAEAERRAAAEEEKRAGALPADDAANVERARADFAKRFARLHKSGIAPEDIEQLKTLGASEQQARQFYGDLLALDEPPPLVGPRATLLQSAAFRREIADQADQVATLVPSAAAAGTTLAQGFLVANPHDRQETVDLFIRPISIPPDWKVSIVNAEQAAAPGQNPPGNAPPAYPVRELEPGKHYAVTLPGKAQIPVRSFLIPVGEVGARSTARWAVEGRIGNELIGGMVHEMNVPYIVAGLELPPVGSVEGAEAPPAAAPRSRTALLAAVAAAILILGFLVLVMIWRRRREQGGPPGRA